METTPNGPAPVTQLGRYRLVEKLGAGGMGVVYRGHDPQLDRAVAVKIPFFHGPPEQVARAAQRFQREARAAAQIHHPHVCPVYDVGEQDGRPYVVMAFLPGPTLAQRLAAGRFEDLGETVGIALQLLDGLAAVHALGVVHRDLKPGNVIFDAAGRAVLTDFGLARPDGDPPLTSAHSVLGTPSYMAPEQAAGQLDRIGPGTDLYSLGVVLYQMVTGRLPFDGPAEAVLPRIIHEAPVPPSRFRPDLDPAVEAAILRALRKDPAERFRTAKEFAAALAGLTPRGAPAPTQDTTLLSPAAPARRAHRWTGVRLLGWAVGSLFVLLPAGFLAFVVRAYLHSTASTDIRVLQAIGLLLLTFLAWVVAVLGVAVWGWVEAVRVPEGLWCFARHGLVGWARRALARGVPADARNDLGETPLLLAAAHGQTEMVKLLLLHGADPSTPDLLGQTPLGAARARGHADIADLLERNARPAPSPSAAAPPWRPDARRWLFASVLLGAGFVVLLSYLQAWRRPLTVEQFLGLVKGKQLKEVTVLEGALTGEVKDADAPEVRPLGLPTGKFWVPVSAVSLPKDLAQRLGPTKLTRSAGDLPLDCWSNPWVILPMLAWPFAALGLTLLPLLGLPSAFPFLALRRGK
jgi:hypothetical protein